MLFGSFDLNWVVIVNFVWTEWSNRMLIVPLINCDLNVSSDKLIPEKIIFVKEFCKMSHNCLDASIEELVHRKTEAANMEGYWYQLHVLLARWLDTKFKIVKSTDIVKSPRNGSALLKYYILYTGEHRCTCIHGINCKGYILLKFMYKKC